MNIEKLGNSQKNFLFRLWGPLMMIFNGVGAGEPDGRVAGGRTVGMAGSQI